MDTEANGPSYPLYQSHKRVRALKIDHIAYDSTDAHEAGRETDGSALIFPVEDYIPAVRVDRNYVQKHSPQAGGYYVVYEDGYESWSPAEAFEGGYSLVDS